MIDVNAKAATYTPPYYIDMWPNGPVLLNTAGSSESAFFHSVGNCTMHLRKVTRLMAQAIQNAI